MSSSRRINATTSIFESPLLLPVTADLVHTCISRETFKKLSSKVQHDYALYYKLKDAELLTADDICRQLCTLNEWIPAADIENHVRIFTTRGLVIVTEVMDLVDWLLEEAVERSALYVDNHLVEAPDLFSEQVEELKTHSDLVQANFLQSCRMARSVFADIFELQKLLSLEFNRSSKNMQTFIDVIGQDHVKHIYRNAVRHSSEKTRSHNTSLQSRLPTKSKQPSIQLEYQPAPSLKRPRDDGNEAPLTITPGSSHTPHLLRSHLSRQSKKLRTENLPKTTTRPPLLWKNYPSESESDDGVDYIPSSGTEVDVMSPGEVVEASVYRKRVDFMPSDDTFSLIEDGVLWKDCSFDEDDSRSDYSTPSLDPETVYEVRFPERPWNPSAPPDMFYYMDDALDQGQRMSEGYCTDETDALDSHHGIDTLRRTYLNLAESMGSYKSFPPTRAPKHIVFHPRTFSLEEVDKRIEDMLSSEYSEYIFDDEAWKYYEDKGI